MHTYLAVVYKIRKYHRLRLSVLMRLIYRAA